MNKFDTPGFQRRVRVRVQVQEREQEQETVIFDEARRDFVDMETTPF